MVKTNYPNTSEELPLIALKDVALFPKIVTPLIVQRPKSIAGLEVGLAKNGRVVFVSQRNLKDDADSKDLFKVGTVGRIVSTNRLTDGSFKIDVDGLFRAKISNVSQEEPFFLARTEPLSLEYQPSIESEALIRSVAEQFKKVTESKIFAPIMPSFLLTLGQIKDPEQLISIISVNLNLELLDQQEILETLHINEALKKA